MGSIGKAFLYGEYRDGVIYTDTFSIRVLNGENISLNSYLDDSNKSYFVGDVYLDLLDRPYFIFEKELPTIPDKDSFISITMYLNDREQIQKVLVNSSRFIWVDFKNITDILSGCFFCSLEYRQGIWYFVPKGGGNS